MTPEEIEKTITQILAVQRELQESQISLQQTQEKLQETQIRQGLEIDRLLELSDRLIRLIVDRVSAELNLEERLLNLAQRVERLESR